MFLFCFMGQTAGINFVPSGTSFVSINGQCSFWMCEFTSFTVTSMNFSLSSCYIAWWKYTVSFFCWAAIMYMMELSILSCLEFSYLWSLLTKASQDSPITGLFTMMSLWGTQTVRPNLVVVRLVVGHCWDGSYSTGIDATYTDPSLFGLASTCSLFQSFLLGGKSRSFSSGRKSWWILVFVGASCGNLVSGILLFNVVAFLFQLILLLMTLISPIVVLLLTL